MSPEIVSTRYIEWVDDAFDDVETKVVEKKRYDMDELSETVGDALGLFVHSENDFNAAVIENAPSLAAIANPGPVSTTSISTQRPRRASSCYTRRG